MLKFLKIIGVALGIGLLSAAFVVAMVLVMPFVFDALGGVFVAAGLSRFGANVATLGAVVASVVTGLALWIGWKTRNVES